MTRDGAVELRQLGLPEPTIDRRPPPLTSFQQVARAAAYTPEDGRRMATNRVLHDFDTALRWVRVTFPVSRPGRAEQRAVLLARACDRVASRLWELVDDA